MMRETMGRYIRELDAEGRDRLVSAPEFSNGQWWDGSCGCLVGTACGEEWAMQRQEQEEEWPLSLGWDRWADTTAEIRYVDAVLRFGKPRVVRSIKLRAARLNGCSPAAIAAMVAQPQEAAR